jgi:DnaJ-class molecular chaperone
MAACPICATEVITCTVCSGSGTVPGDSGAAQPCTTCGGKGFVHAATGLPDSCHE